METVEIYKSRSSFNGVRQGDILVILSDLLPKSRSLVYKVGLHDGRVLPVTAETVRMFNSYFERIA